MSAQKAVDKVVAMHTTQPSVMEFSIVQYGQKFKLQSKWMSRKFATYNFGYGTLNMDEAGKYRIIVNVSGQFKKNGECQLCVNHMPIKTALWPRKSLCSTVAFEVEVDLDMDDKLYVKMLKGSDTDELLIGKFIIIKRRY